MDPFGDQQTKKTKNKNHIHQKYEAYNQRSSDEDEQNYERSRYHRQKQYQEDSRSRYHSKYPNQQSNQLVKCSSCRATYQIDAFAFQDLVPSLQKQWMFKCKNCSNESKIPERFRSRVQDLYPKWKSVMKKQGWSFFGDETSSSPSQTEQQMKQRLRKKGHRFKDDYLRTQDRLNRLAEQLQEIIDINRQLGEDLSDLSANSKKEGLSALEITLLPQSKFSATVDNKDQICSICLSNYMEEESLITLPCNHCYHADCITKWLLQKQVCPLCKSYMVVVEEEEEGKFQQKQQPKDEHGQNCGHHQLSDM